jgi:hypothetical protein
VGLIVYPKFRSTVPTTKPRTSGEFLARAIDTLDEIADEHGLVRFTAFGDQRTITRDFDGPPWELEEIMGPCEDWFPAAEGRAAFIELARLIREAPEAAGRFRSPDYVADELEDLARCLEVAEGLGIDFRLAMS